MQHGYPDGWSKTMEDLVNDGAPHSGQELEWARAYERDLLKKAGARFPTAGDIYQALRDVEITCMTHWHAPVTGGEKAVLPAGAKIRPRLDASSDPEPIGIYAETLDAEPWEAALVPEPDRRHDAYAGYSVFVSTAQLNKDFVRLPHEAP